MFKKEFVKQDAFFDDLNIISSGVHTESTEKNIKKKKEVIISKTELALEYLVYRSGVFSCMLSNKYNNKKVDDFQNYVQSQKILLKDFKNSLEKVNSESELKISHDNFYNHILKDFNSENKIIELNVFKMGLFNQLQNINLAFLKRNFS